MLFRSTALFSQTDPTSYTSTTSGTVYDTLGNAHVLSMYFVRTAVAGTWNVYGSVDGTALANVDLGAGPGTAVSMSFDSAGKLTTAMPFAAQATVTSGATTPIAFGLDFTGSTQYGSPFSVNALTQDGFASGHLSGLNVGTDGILKGRYSNGQSKNLGQIVLSDFANPQGLMPLGANQWAESSASGLPVIGVPGVGSAGVQIGRAHV